MSEIYVPIQALTLKPFIMNNQLTNPFSFIHRFLHWSLALGILCILFTVFLRTGWMNKDHMAQIIMNSGNNISEENAIKIAKAIRKPMFNWHMYMGYFVCAIYVLRLIYIAVYKNLGLKFKQGNVKEKFQTSVYIIFYLVLGITLISGLFIELGPKAYKGFFESIHQPVIYFMVVFLIIHLAGIFIGENTTTKGIVSQMISGKNSHE